MGLLQNSHVTAETQRTQRRSIAISAHPASRRYVLQRDQALFGLARAWTIGTFMMRNG